MMTVCGSTSVHFGPKQLALGFLVTITLGVMPPVGFTNK